LPYAYSIKAQKRDTNHDRFMR